VIWEVKDTCHCQSNLCACSERFYSRQQIPAHVATRWARVAARWARVDPFSILIGQRAAFAATRRMTGIAPFPIRFVAFVAAVRNFQNFLQPSSSVEDCDFEEVITVLLGVVIFLRKFHRPPHLMGYCIREFLLFHGWINVTYCCSNQQWTISLFNENIWERMISVNI